MSLNITTEVLLQHNTTDAWNIVLAKGEKRSTRQGQRYVSYTWGTRPDGAQSGAYRNHPQPSKSKWSSTLNSTKISLSHASLKRLCIEHVGKEEQQMRALLSCFAAVWWEVFTRNRNWTCCDWGSRLGCKKYNVSRHSFPTVLNKSLISHLKKGIVGLALSVLPW